MRLRATAGAGRNGQRRPPPRAANADYSMERFLKRRRGDIRGGDVRLQGMIHGLHAVGRDVDAAKVREFDP